MDHSDLWKRFVDLNFDITPLAYTVAGCPNRGMVYPLEVLTVALDPRFAHLMTTPVLLATAITITLNVYLLQYQIAGVWRGSRGPYASHVR